MHVAVVIDTTHVCGTSLQCQWMLMQWIYITYLRTMLIQLLVFDTVLHEHLKLCSSYLVYFLG